MNFDIRRRQLLESTYFSCTIRPGLPFLERSSMHFFRGEIRKRTVLQLPLRESFTTKRLVSCPVGLPGVTRFAFVFKFSAAHIDSTASIPASQQMPYTQVNSCRDLALHPECLASTPFTCSHLPYHLRRCHWYQTSLHPLEETLPPAP